MSTTSQSPSGETPASAMVLTEREWLDLAHICRCYLAVAQDDECGHLDHFGLGDLTRIDTVARRVIEASQ